MIYQVKTIFEMPRVLPLQNSFLFEEDISKAVLIFISS